MIASQQSIFARRVLAIGAAFALLAVMSGAFAAHGLEATLGAPQLALFETAARYQMYHALALLVVATVSTMPRISAPALKLAAWAFVIGIVLFSGSLYLLALSGVRWLGAVTPLGGISFLVGWLALIVAALKPLPGDD